MRIRLTTKPAGAEVTLEGESASARHDADHVTLPRGNDVRRVILAAPGYARAVAEVTPDVDSRLYFESRARRAPSTSPRKLKPVAEPNLTLPTYLAPRHPRRRSN